MRRLSLRAFGPCPLLLTLAALGACSQDETSPGDTPVAGAGGSAAGGSAAGGSSAGGAGGKAAGGSSAGGSSAGGSSTGGSSAGGSSAGTAGTATAGGPPGDPFAACGAAIFAPDTGVVDAMEYRKQAVAWDQATLDCRLGPRYEAYHPGEADTRPDIWQPATKTYAAGHNGQGMPYQLGSPDPAVTGRFGSVVGQVFYLPTDPADPGVDRVSTYDWDASCIDESVTPVWWGGSHPEPATQRPDWVSAHGGPVVRPFAQARSHLSWSNDALMLFPGGFLGAAGTQTSSDTFPTFTFPASKVPTSVAVSSYNEFAFVTIWDTETLQGEVAVLALEGRGLVHGWYYPGFPSVGSYSALKLLGYIPLPGMHTPTAISVAGNNGAGLITGGIVLGQYKLDTQETRDAFATGDKRSEIATAGYAMVASRWENKVAFLDLKPLFQSFRAMYLTTQASFDETQTAAGPAPDQWPYAFSARPGSAPTLATMVDVTAPTAVLAGRQRYGSQTNAFVASLDGTLTRLDVSTLATDGPTDPAAVKVLGHGQVGLNPVSLVFPRNGDPKDPKASPYDYNDSFLVASRGDRRIDWVTTTEIGVSVFRSLQDRRLDDPVAVEVGERAYVLTVADFSGHKLVNYRLAPTPSDHVDPPQSFGLGPDGQGDVECGGAMVFPGPVFAFTETNVN